MFIPKNIKLQTTFFNKCDYGLPETQEAQTNYFTTHKLFGIKSQLKFPGVIFCTFISPSSSSSGIKGLICFFNLHILIYDHYSEHVIDQSLGERLSTNSVVWSTKRKFFLNIWLFGRNISKIWVEEGLKERPNQRREENLWMYSSTVLFVTTKSLVKSKCKWNSLISWSHGVCRVCYFFQLVIAPKITANNLNFISLII